MSKRGSVQTWTVTIHREAVRRHGGTRSEKSPSAEAVRSLVQLCEVPGKANRFGRWGDRWGQGWGPGRDAQARQTGFFGPWDCSA